MTAAMTQTDIRAHLHRVIDSYCDRFDVKTIGQRREPEEALNDGPYRKLVPGRFATLTVEFGPKDPS